MRPSSPVPKYAVFPSDDFVEHQANAASSVTGAAFIPGTTSPTGSTMLPVASPSSKSFAEFCRNIFVIAA